METLPSSTFQSEEYFIDFLRHYATNEQLRDADIAQAMDGWVEELASQQKISSDFNTNHNCSNLLSHCTHPSLRLSCYSSRSNPFFHYPHSSHGHVRCLLQTLCHMFWLTKCAEQIAITQHSLTKQQYETG